MVIEKKIALRGRERGRKVFSCPCFSGFVFTSGRSSSPQRGAAAWRKRPAGKIGGCRALPDHQVPTRLSPRAAQEPVEMKSKTRLSGSVCLAVKALPWARSA